MRGKAPPFGAFSESELIRARAIVVLLGNFLVWRSYV